ncbi:MAG: flippase-like domain-containing protein [Oscillospiraceae bacterium]|nr:flippase-like domain-containing protein [Oscillospiraceae bacterium]
MSGKKKLFWSLFSTLLAALSIWAVLSQSKKWSLESIIESLKNADPVWLCLAVLGTVLFVVFECAALTRILKGIGYPRPFRRSLLYSTSDIYFSAITPSATGGQPASAYFMVKDGIPAGAATVALLVNLILYTVSLVILGLAAVIAYPSLFFRLGLVAKILIGVGFVLQLGLTIVFFILLGKGPFVFGVLRRFLHFLHRKKIVHRLQRKLDKLDKAQWEYESCAKVMKGKRGAFALALVWNILQRASQLSVPACLYMALGGRLSGAGPLFAAQCLVVNGYAPVPIPGAMGVADFLMLDAFSCLGFIAAEEVLRLEMLSRGLSFYLCVAVSGVITLIGYLLLRKKEKGVETP